MSSIRPVIVRVDVPISNDVKLQRVEELLNRELPGIFSRIEGLLRAPKYKGISGIGNEGMALRFSLYTSSIKRSLVKRAFLQEMKYLFDENNISVTNNRIIVANDNSNA